MLSPAVLRPPRAVAAGKAATQELLVSASAIAALLGSLGFGAAEAMFAAAFGVLIDGVLLTIESAATMEASGSAYLYRLILRQPIAEAV